MSFRARQMRRYMLLGVLSLLCWGSSQSSLGAQTGPEDSLGATESPSDSSPPSSVEANTDRSPDTIIDPAPLPPTTDAGVAEDQLQRFRRFVLNGTEKYKEGDFEGAAQEFEDAYGLKPVPNLLYNIGRSFERAGVFEKAVEYFERYVQLPEVKLQHRKDALERLQALREVVAMQRSKAAEPQANTSESEANFSTTDTGEPGSQSAAVDARNIARDGEDGSSGRTTSYILLASGGAMLIGSGVLAYLTDQTYRDFRSARTLQERRDAGSTGEVYSVIADSLLTGAVTTLVIGTIIYFASGDEPEIGDGVEVTITPSFTGHSTTIGLSGSF